MFALRESAQSRLTEPILANTIVATPGTARRICINGLGAAGLPGVLIALVIHGVDRWKGREDVTIRGYRGMCYVTTTASRLAVFAVIPDQKR